jgi:S1-C subfamily serine protease
MKNAVWLVIGLLLLWNIFISISLNDIQNETVSEDNNTVYVENTINGYVTDITKVVANTDSQVVTVKAMVNENEYIASGFIYKYLDDSAYIVTNNHVVNNVENIMVRFDNGIEANAEIFGFDKYYDIAILKVEVDFEVDTVKLGNSSILNKNILARISIQGSVYSIMSDSSLILKSLPRQYFGPIDIQKLQIQLLDEYGRVLDLNNMDFSFALKLECLYSN